MSGAGAEAGADPLDLSVIIPFKDRAQMTAMCLRSLARFGPAVRETLLVSNGSRPDELARMRSEASEHPRSRVVEYNHPFNYQKLMNFSARQASAGTLVFLNNDTELVAESEGLVERMYARAQEPDVGITGCLLLYGDRKTIQHAGVFLVPKGTADHLYVGKPLLEAERLGGASRQYPYEIGPDRPVTAVTGAVSVVRRDRFEAVGGFDERFIMCGGDVDLCIRMNMAGHQTWFVGGGHLIHKESVSRRQKPIPYSDFYYSFHSYLKGYDVNVGDPFLPEITRDAAS